MFFGKPIDSLTYEDIQRFCEESVPEGWPLEYKLKDSQSVVKTACAFANTVGGIIVVGVEEENERPKPPFLGLEMAELEKVYQSIRDSILEHTYPTLIPDVRRIADGSSTRGFIVVRVDRSSVAPHAYKSREIYVRYRDRNNPERFSIQPADLDWLRDQILHRHRKTAYYEDRLGFFDEICTNTWKLYPDQAPAPATPVLYSFSCCPTFSIPEAIDERHLRKLKIELMNHVSDPKMQPFYHVVHSLRTEASGYFGFANVRRPSLLYLGNDGFLGFRCSPIVEQIDEHGAVSLDGLQDVFNLFMSLSQRFCKCLSIEFGITIRATIDNVSGTFPLVDSTHSSKLDHKDKLLPSRSLSFGESGLPRDIFQHWQTTDVFLPSVRFREYLSRAYGLGT